MKNKKFYITTPIYYVTAKPHLGSLYSTLLADVLNRWHILQGNKTFFLTGTDEHGQKVAQAAQKVGKDPKHFVDSFIDAYKNTWKKYQIDYSYFVRTTDHEHIHGAQQFIKKLIDSSDIYKSQYEGWYCTPCETFLTDSSISLEQLGNELDNNAPLCSSCARPTEFVKEETYFFKLSAYQNKLLQFYTDHPDFIVPKERTKEVISFVQAGLKDISISRTTVKWGVPFPDDPAHTVYVWVEALCNYITAIGYGNPAKEQDFKQWWPANMQVLGKDIVRFHGIFWPAFLMAADLPLPKRLLVHGWIKIDHQKMSKSLGNVIDPLVLANAYGVDAVRYYLVRQIPINQDGNFSIADLEQRITSDLANDLGNLLNRLVMLAQKYEAMFIKAPTSWHEKALDLRDESLNALQEFEMYMNDCMFHLALARLWKFINQVNAYFHEQEPWKQAKQNKDLFLQTLSATAHSLRTVGVLLWPVMPRKMNELLQSLGVLFDPKNHTLENIELGNWGTNFMFKKISALFEKPEQKKESDKKQEAEIAQENYIAIDDLAKIELRIGTIEQCEKIEKSEKLLKMQVNLGELGIWQILAGIAKHYSADELIGRQGLFVCNLKPRKMMGIESQGMMLIVPDENKKPQLIAPEINVPNGLRLQ